MDQQTAGRESGRRDLGRRRATEGQGRERGDEKRDLSERREWGRVGGRGLIFPPLYTCKLKPFLPSEGQGPLSSSPVPTV